MTTDEGTPPASPLPEVAVIQISDILAALQAAWFDFRAAPIFGLFFSGMYVAAGMIITQLSAGTVLTTLLLALGFPLFAPFAAVAYYEISRRLEADEPLIWTQVMAVVIQQKNRQLPWLGAIVTFYFLFWAFLAHMILALFVGPSALISSASVTDVLLDTQALPLIATELAVGGVLAYLLFALTAVSMPLLLDQEIDFVTAMLISLQVVRRNPLTMTLWAAIIAVVLFVAMLPSFLGLFIALPLLGHATWHIYRRALYAELA